jgi:hypothetical protein
MKVLNVHSFNLRIAVDLDLETGHPVRYFAFVVISYKKMMA